MAEYIVWGGGGHGKVVADVAREAGFSICGFVDSDPAKLGTDVEPGHGSVIMLQDDFLLKLQAASLPTNIAAVILGIGNNTDRQLCRQNVPDNFLHTVIHPSAMVSRYAMLGAGTVVMPSAIINSGAQLGLGVIVNSGAIVEHDCDVGDDVHVAPGAILAGNVKLGQRVLVGAGAVIIPGVRIGSDVVVGAGAVVIRDIPSGAIVAGNPAKPITK